MFKLSIKIGGFRVLVKPEKVEDIDPAYASAKRMGIQIVGSEKEREQNAVDKGVIVQIGSTVANEFDGDLFFEVGDQVLFSRYSGKKVTDPENEEDYIIFNGEDILCVINESKETLSNVE